MTDPKRWVDDGAPGAVGLLLVAAREEQPSASGVTRTLSALGVGGAAMLGAGHAAGAGGATAGLAGSGAVGTLATKAAIPVAVIMKWALIGAACGVLTVGPIYAGRALRERGAPELTATAGTAAAGSRPTAPGDAPQEPPIGSSPEVPGVAAPPANETSSSVSLPGVPPPAGVGGKPGAGSGGPRSTRTERLEPTTTSTIEAQGPGRDPRSSPALLREVEAINRARTALGAGNATLALSQLDHYSAEYGAPHFEPEALFLRMEALGRLGDKRGQRFVAERLATRFGSAPQAARARAILQGEVRNP